MIYYPQENFGKVVSEGWSTPLFTANPHALSGLQLRNEPSYKVLAIAGYWAIHLRRAHNCIGHLPSTNFNNSSFTVELCLAIMIDGGRLAILSVWPRLALVSWEDIIRRNL